MPNHMHGIVILTEAQATDDDMRVGADPKTDVGAISKINVGAGLKPAPTTHHGLSEIVRAFKTFSARRINALHNTVGTPFWQRNYYEHIIRNQSALDRIRQYIADNPARWSEDLENPAVGDG